AAGQGFPAPPRPRRAKNSRPGAPGGQQALDRERRRSIVTPVSEQGCPAPEETPAGNAEPAAEGGVAVGRKVRKDARPKAGGAGGLRTKPGAVDEEETILREATKYLIRKVGGHLVATGLREEQHRGGRRWLIAVTLRYPTGYEAYYGDLLYDGKDFSF